MKRLVIIKSDLSSITLNIVIRKMATKIKKSFVIFDIHIYLF